MVESVSDFLKVVEAFYPDDGIAFFRGQGSSEWAVNSSLCRLIKDKLGNINDNALNWRFARSLFSEFERNIPSYPEASILKSYSPNQLDLMFVAQHYGLSTRLIDWSKNPLIALYFAVEKIEKKDNGNSAVYMIFNSERQKVNVFSSQAFFDYYAAEKNIWTEFYKVIEEKISNILTNEEKDIRSISFNDLSIFNKIINDNSTASYVDINLSFSLHSDELNHFNFSLLPIRIMQDMHEKERMDDLRFYMEIKKLLEKDNAHLNFFSNISNGKIFTNNNVCIINPLPLNPRIKNQQGVFLFSNSINEDVYCLDAFNEHNTIIEFNSNMERHYNDGVLKILIPNKFARKIRKELGYYGITKDFVYPELSSYTEVMQEKILRKYIDEAKTIEENLRKRE